MKLSTLMRVRWVIRDWGGGPLPSHSLPYGDPSTGKAPHGNYLPHYSSTTSANLFLKTTLSPTINIQPRELVHFIINSDVRHIWQVRVGAAGGWFLIRQTMQNYEAAIQENSIYICVTHTLYVSQCFVFLLFGIDWTVFPRLSLKWIAHYAFKSRRNLLSSSCNITKTQSGHYKLLGWVFMVSTNMMSTGRHIAIVHTTTTLSYETALTTRVTEKETAVAFH